MNILLIGSTGFVGQHLKKRLESFGHTVTTLGHAHTWGSEQYSLYDAMINCAAELTKESEMWMANVQLVKRLLDLMRDGLVGKRFIQIGSSSEYGRTNDARHEDSVCVPTNIYEATKLSATALCQGYAERYDLDVCIARPFSLYGPGDKPRKLIPTLYRSFMDHTSVTVKSGSHDWIYIDDFIDGIMLLLYANRRETTKGQIFNFGTGISYTNRETVEALESALGSKLNVTYVDGRHHAHDVDNWVADSYKARSVLGWEVKYDLKRGMKEYVMAEWFKTDKG